MVQPTETKQTHNTKGRLVGSSAEYWSNYTSSTVGKISRHAVANVSVASKEISSNQSCPVFTLQSFSHLSKSKLVQCAALMSDKKWNCASVNNHTNLTLRKNALQCSESQLAAVSAHSEQQH